jgi:putative ABC transport system substrate-binding protein
MFDVRRRDVLTLLGGAAAWPRTVAAQGMGTRRIGVLMELAADEPQARSNVAGATGTLLYDEGITGKWLSLLKDIAPRVTRAAVVANPKAFDYYLRAAEATAPSLGLALVPYRVESAADIEQAIDSFARTPNGGLFLPPDRTTVFHRDLVIALAARHRLPAIYNGRFWIAAGGLLSYATDYVELYRQTATYVDRILRGDKPDDLPVQAPIKYETVLNLKTARALGLTVPDLMLVRADEVIE